MRFLLAEEDNKKKDVYLGERPAQAVDSLGNNINEELLSEGLHSLGSNCFITDSPYDIKNLIMNKPKLYRILYDANIDMYMIGDGNEIIHWDMIQEAYKQGYYANQEEFIEELGGALDNYVDTGIYGLYDDDYEVDPYLLYMVFSPDEDEFVLGEDGYDGVSRFGFGSLFFRDADQGLMDNCDLIRILQKQSWANVNESVSHQDEKAVREFVDECKADGLPLMDYKEFSELLNEQGMTPNEELYQVYVDAYNDEKDDEEDNVEVVRKKFETMSSNEIIDLLGVPNTNDIDDNSPMYLLPNGSILSVAKVSKLKDCIHSDIVYTILSAIANKLGIEFEDDDHIYEERKLDYLTYGLEWARLNCGTTWTESRFYCVLPNHMTSAQYRSLEKWLEWGYDNKKEKVIAFVGRDEASQAYYFDETFPEDIIKKIKRYYSSGRLYENRNELKENMNEEFVNELVPGELYHFIHNNKILYGTFKRKTPAWLFFDVEGKEVLTEPWTSVATTAEELEELIGLVDKMEKDTKIPSQVPNRFTRVPNQHNKPMGESNELEQRAKKHKKKSKGMGWHMSMNAGDVEKGIEVFNNSTSLGNSSSGGEGTAMGEAIAQNTYYYDGPVYYDGRKIATKSDIYTTATSLNLAIRNTLYKAAKGDKELYHYDIVDDMVRQIPKEETPKVRPKCQTCGYDLNDIGDCPVCDYGEDDLLESLSDLEALWKLGNLD